MRFHISRQVWVDFDALPDSVDGGNLDRCSLFDLVTDCFKVGPQVFIKTHTVEDRRLTVCGDARFRCADDDAEFIRVAAVLEPFFHFRSGVHSPQRLFNSILRSQSAVDLYAVPNGPALYLDRIGIVVPVNVQVVSQHVQRRFVQFVDTGVNDVPSDFRRGRLQLR